MRGENTLFLINWMHGLEREGGAPVQNRNHINTVCFPIFAFQCSPLGTAVQSQDFACEHINSL